MDVRGKKVLVFGNSLSASDSSPGGGLAARLRDVGARSCAWWPVPVTAAVAAAGLIGAAVYVRRRNALRSLGRVAGPSRRGARPPKYISQAYDYAKTELARTGCRVDGSCLEASVLMHKWLVEHGVDAKLVRYESPDFGGHWTVRTPAGEFDPTISAWPEAKRWGYRGLVRVSRNAPHTAWAEEDRHSEEADEAVAYETAYVDWPPKRTLRGPEALPASARQHVHKAIADEIDGAVERALAAGAKAPLEYIGAGAEGIVFCDPTQTAYKVGRGANSLADEAQFFRKATQVPGVKEHVAKFKRYDAKHNVIVRECVRGERVKWSQERKVYDLHRDIEKTMEPYGFLSPERKPDSWVLVRGRGPVLVDAGFATQVGHELVKHTLDVINGRSPRGAYESNESLAFHIRNERDKTIPTKVANKILRRLYETPQNARKWAGSDEAAQVFGE